jgi:hypothetical protein
MVGRLHTTTLLLEGVTLAFVHTLRADQASTDATEATNVLRASLMRNVGDPLTVEASKGLELLGRPIRRDNEAETLTLALHSRWFISATAVLV